MNISKELFGGPSAKEDPIAFLNDMYARSARLNKQVAKLSKKSRGAVSKH